MNNLSERTLRMVAIGRKNYMFAGSEAGAKRAAIIYSLVARCKLNKIRPLCVLQGCPEPYQYSPGCKIDERLPGNWKKSENSAKETAA